AELFLYQNFTKDTPFQDCELRFRQWGFKKEWGNSAQRVLETMRYSDILQAPDLMHMN
ncbi:hypothetical protein CMV_025670, partial [Castanea mollissima]